MNPIVHFEIHAKNQNLLQTFYENVFGWKFEDLGPTMGNYRLIHIENSCAPTIKGGLNHVPEHVPVAGAPINAFVNIIGVENIYEHVTKVQSENGKIVYPVMDIPTAGLLAYCTDPEGNMFGMLQSKESKS